MKEKAHILVVDDSISMCRSMALILERKGYSVTTAVDGLEAIDRVREKPFDIIFMDIKMPGLDGVETYRRIKQIRPNSVIVMMAGYWDNDLVEGVQQEGAYAVLYKPLDMEKVLTMINENIQENQRASSL